MPQWYLLIPTMVWKVENHKSNHCCHQRLVPQSHLPILQLLPILRSYNGMYSCRAPSPVPSCFPVWSLPIHYLSLTHLASLGLIKGRGQTLYLISDHHHPPPTTTAKLFLASGVSIPIPCCSMSHPIPYLSLAHPLPIPYSSPIFDFSHHPVFIVP